MCRIGFRVAGRVARGRPALPRLRPAQSTPQKGRTFFSSVFCAFWPRRVRRKVSVGLRMLTVHTLSATQLLDLYPRMLVLESGLQKSSYWCRAFPNNTTANCSMYKLSWNTCSIPELVGPWLRWMHANRDNVMVVQHPKGQLQRCM